MNIHIFNKENNNIYILLLIKSARRTKTKRRKFLKFFRRNLFS